MLILFYCFVALCLMTALSFFVQRKSRREKRERIAALAEQRLRVGNEFRVFFETVAKRNSRLRIAVHPDCPKKGYLIELSYMRADDKLLSVAVLSVMLGEEGVILTFCQGGERVERDEEKIFEMLENLGNAFTGQEVHQIAA